MKHFETGLKQLALVGLYVLLALGLQMTDSHVVGFRWLAGGLAWVAVWQGGKSFLLAALLGATLGNWMVGGSLLFSLWVALRHVVGIFLGVWLLQYEGRFDARLKALGDYLRVIALALFIGLFAAITSIALEYLLPHALMSEFHGFSFNQRWMGNSLAVSLVVPLLLVWRTPPRDWLHLNSAAETVLILGLSWLVGQVIFLDWLHDSLGQFARGYWMFLFVTWAAVRLGAHGTTWLVTVTAIQGLVGAQLGTGFFSNDIEKTLLANYFFYMFCLAMVGMALATVFTQRKRAEQELIRYKDHLEEQVQLRTTDLVLARNAAEAANRSKSVFLANMSHELRTPLNAILGFSSLMRQEAHLTGKQRQNLDIINRSGEHLLSLINEVLEMAKIEAGRVQLEDAPFDLGGMVRDVTDMMELRAKEKGLTLLLDQSSEFPRFIRGDEARLRQILINLVGNAIKFTYQGGVTIRLGVQENSFSHLMMEVEDSGRGIAVADQQRLFQPFVQLGQQAADNKGTGLGLAITQQFVQLMGGKISLESALGKGTLFRVDLPLKVIEASEMVHSDAQRNNVIGLAAGQPIYRVLIVEDQLENQLLLVQLMEKLGFPVKVAENGAIGVEMFESWRPDIIWMDRRMPVMDGLAAAQRIRALPHGRAVKMVAVTASAFMEQRAEMIATGMDDFVRKPYRFHEIYDCLARQLGVQYQYADTPEISVTPVLDAAMLAVLPLSLREALRAALESLEDTQIRTVIAQVAQYDAALQKVLSDLVENYDYPAILTALSGDAQGK